MSVTMLAATYLVYTSQVRFHRGVYGVFKILVVWHLLKMFGLPSWLLDDDDELSMDKRDRLVCRDSDSPYNTTDL